MSGTKSPPAWLGTSSESQPEPQPKKTAMDARMTDAELINSVLRGNLSAFNTLVWRWEKPLYNFALRYMGNREEAKDVCQVALLRAYQKLGSLRDPERFSTWMYQITVNVCRDELRKKKRKVTSSLDQLQDDNMHTTLPQLQMEKHPKSDPELAAQNYDVRHLLNRALQEIPEDQRVVIIMKEYQGLKFTEIAAALDISVNTAKSRMYYGLSAIRQLFSKWGIDKEKLVYEL